MFRDFSGEVGYNIGRVETKGKTMTKDEEKEFEKILDIDKYRLDEESLLQPRRVWHYGKLTAKAQKALDEAAAELKVVEADVDAAVREDPSAFDLEKLNETAIKRAILRSKDYQEALKAFNDANYRVNMLEAANRSLDHRRTSLSNLNGQDERGYFSRPREGSKKDTGKHDFRSKKKR
jgi:hypothetical protein